MKEIITRSGITPVGSPKYRINRLRYHLLAYSISRRAKLDGLKSKYIIRCDDTNAKNTNRSFLYAYIEVLQKNGVCPDILPYQQDESGHSLFQSERTEIYQIYLRQLIRDGLAYFDDTGATMFDTIMFEKRFKHLMPEGKLRVSDISMGKLSIDIRTPLYDKSGEMGLVPFPLTRSNGSLLFNFASPVDDALLGVTHIVRDRDKLSLLPKQEMVRIALGFPEFIYVHAPFIVDNSGKRLVQDDYFGEATYQDFVSHGILPKAIVSYLLSTIAGQSEKFYDSIDDFAKLTDFTHIHKANTKFTPAILALHNKKAMKVCSEQEYQLALKNHLVHFDAVASRLLFENRDVARLLFKLKCKFSESAKIIKALLDPQYVKIKPESQELIARLLKKFSETLSETDWSVDELLGKKTMNFFKVQKKEYFQALRYIFTGEYHGLDLHEIIKYLIEKDLINHRLETAKRQ